MLHFKMHIAHWRKPDLFSSVMWYNCRGGLFILWQSFDVQQTKTLKVNGLLHAESPNKIKDIHAIHSSTIFSFESIHCSQGSNFYKFKSWGYFKSTSRAFSPLQEMFYTFRTRQVRWKPLHKRKRVLINIISLTILRGSTRWGYRLQ